MPLYEYECEGCGAIIEALQRFSDKPLSRCSRCSGRLHRLISRSAFHLKGSGWYVTDYAGKSQCTAAKPHASAPPAAENQPATRPADGSKTPE